MLRLTILGCGSSGGVPRLGGLWGACDPDEPRNHRRRCSVLVERVGPAGCTRVLIDASPDLRSQLLDAQIGTLDAVLFTHEHADHCHGLDDLRMVVFNRKARLPVWASPRTGAELMAKFGYAFVQPEGSDYPPILDLHDIDGTVRIDGAGGEIAFTPFEVVHGQIPALGFRFDDIAYLPDVNAIPETVWPLLEGLDLWVLDALRYTPHPSHAHLDLALQWIQRAAPRRAVLTNMHIDLDFATLTRDLPAHIRPAHDGMVIEAAG